MSYLQKTVVREWKDKQSKQQNHNIFFWAHERLKLHANLVNWVPEVLPSSMERLDIMNYSTFDRAREEESTVKVDWKKIAKILVNSQMTGVISLRVKVNFDPKA